MLGKESIANVMTIGHAANVVELPDGRLFVNWYVASYEGAEDQRIAGAVRNPDGTWQPTHVLIGAGFDFDGTRWTPEIGVPVLRPDGELDLYFGAVPQENFGMIQDRRTFVIRTGAAWLAELPVSFTVPLWRRGIGISATFFARLTERSPGVFEAAQPQRLPLDERESGKWVLPFTPPLKLKSGRWVLAYTVGLDPPAIQEYRCRFLVSDENQENWQVQGDIWAERGVAEPVITQLSSGDILCYMRGASGQGATDIEVQMHNWRCVSSDECKTFSEPVQTNLRNPDSSVHIAISSTSGRLIIVYNDSYGQRTPLSVGVSEDEGKTFRVRDIEISDGGFAYPKLLQARDGIWHLFYSYKYAWIEHAWFEEDWLEGGRDVIGLRSEPFPPPPPKSPYPSEMYLQDFDGGAS